MKARQIAYEEKPERRKTTYVEKRSAPIKDEQSMTKITKPSYEKKIVEKKRLPEPKVNFMKKTLQ